MLYEYHNTVCEILNEYLKKNYGIQIDESRFTVFYEVFAKNLMPEITVMENQERVD